MIESTSHFEDWDYDELMDEPLSTSPVKLDGSSFKNENFIGMKKGKIINKEKFLDELEKLTQDKELRDFVKMIRSGEKTRSPQPNDKQSFEYKVCWTDGQVDKWDITQAKREITNLIFSFRDALNFDSSSKPEKDKRHITMGDIEF